MSSRSKTLYVGGTNNLERRVYEHKSGLVRSFTSRYRIDRLVYYEDYPDARAALAREKQIKAWRRQKKIDLIEALNPEWDDIAERWYAGGGSSSR
jgi:putative endonuclease